MSDEPKPAYVRLQCRGTDRATGEPREWHHEVNANDAERRRGEILALWPDVTVEIKGAAHG